MSALIPVAIVVVVVALPLIWAIAMYNALVRLRNLCNESWADIDTELRRRYDLIPNLVSAVKGYMAHERQTLERVIEARNRASANHGTPAEQARDENMLIGALRNMFALAEAYPDLKANHGFAQLQRELVNTEDRIQRARRFYNANVRDLNTRCEVVPSNFIARMFGFENAEYFEIEDSAARAPVAVAI